LPFNGYYVKDLARIGRDLQKTLLVDNIAENFQLQPHNGVFIKTWISDPNDTSLFDLAPILIKIVTENIKDIRNFMKNLCDTDQRVLQKVAYGDVNEQ
jgi:CTD small phosphatase-like protein 2